MYEVEMVGFAHFGDTLDKFWAAASTSEQQMLRMVLRSRLAGAMTSERFIDSINQGTTRESAVNARFDAWFKALEPVTRNIRGAVQEGDLIHRAMMQSPICAECPFPMSPEDAVWAAKGKEQKLAHRFCKARRQ